MIVWLTDWLVDRWMRRCQHSDNHVMADLLEGCADPYGNLHAGRHVRYCRRCGAVRPSFAAEWRSPQPLAPDGWLAHRPFAWMIPQRYRWLTERPR